MKTKNDFRPLIGVIISNQMVGGIVYADGATSVPLSGLSFLIPVTLYERTV